MELVSYTYDTLDPDPSQQWLNGKEDLSYKFVKSFEGT
jgi:hypothetical protein